MGCFPPAPFLFVGLAELAQLFIECAFLGREFFRDLHLNAQIQVAATLRAEPWQSLAAQAQHLIRLGTGRHRDIYFSLQGRYFYPGAKYGVGDFEGFSTSQIGAGAFEA